MWDLPEKKINKEFFNNNGEVIEKLHREFGVDNKFIESSVKEIQKWVVEQPELPKESQDKEFIRNAFEMSKYKEKKAKKMITGYFKMFTTYPRIFRNFHALNELHISSGYVAQLKNMTPNGEHVILYKFASSLLEGYSIHDMIITGFPFYFLGSHFIGCVPVRIISDLEGLTLQHYKSIDIASLIKYTNIYRDGLKNRVTSIDHINTPPFYESILGLVSMFMPPKLQERMKFYKNLESLHKVVPKEILPKEYGGSEYTFEELRETSNQLIIQNRDFFDKVISLVPKNIEEDTIFGAEGTFKTLSID